MTSTTQPNRADIAAKEAPDNPKLEMITLDQLASETKISVASDRRSKQIVFVKDRGAWRQLLGRLRTGSFRARDRRYLPFRANRRNGSLRPSSGRFPL